MMFDEGVSRHSNRETVKFDLRHRGRKLTLIASGISRRVGVHMRLHILGYALSRRLSLIRARTLDLRLCPCPSPRITPCGYPHGPGRSLETFRQAGSAAR